MNQLILAGSISGFFKAKTLEKRLALMPNVMEQLPDSELTESEVFEILQAESQRRSVLYQQKQKAKLEKELNKPVQSGYESNKPERLYNASFIVTTAQNNTEVHQDFIDALEKYAEFTHSKLIVCETLYNKNAFKQPDEVEDKLYFDSRIEKYIIRNNVMLADNLMLVSAANVIPTAKNPLSGFESLGGNEIDLIIPSVKMSLKCTAALKGSKGKVLYSTGAVTKMNYIQRKAGQVAESGHTIGALIVEVDAAGIANIRQLEFINGVFYDNCLCITPTAIINNQYPKVIQFGDIHSEKSEGANIAYAKSLIEKYHPVHVMLHDLVDFSSRNHHNRKDCTFVYRQDKGRNSVVSDLNKVTSTLNSLYESVSWQNCQFHVIESNHDLALERWLKEADFKLDSVNAEFYLWAMLALYRNSHNDDFNILEYVMKHGFAVQDIYGNYLNSIPESENSNIVFHKTDESVIIAGVEHGCHGHNGINGARGSTVGFAKLGVPINTGHTHTPEIYGKAWTAGVLGALDMGYNTGPSSWRIASIITWPNGGRQMIFK